MTSALVLFKGKALNRPKEKIDYGHRVRDAVENVYLPFHIGFAEK